MIHLQEAVAILRRRVPRLSTERVPLSSAHRRVLSEEVRAPHPVPRFRRAMMDGYAIHREDIANVDPQHPVSLQVTGVTVAGESNDGGPGSGEAWEIATGAPVPDETDVVVPHELTRVPESGSDPEIPYEIQVNRSVSKSNIAPPGEDIQEGTEILGAGRSLHGSELGLLASLGVEGVDVYRQPRVAVLITGDELVAPGQPLRPGQIYDSNGFSIPSRVRDAGGEVVFQQQVPDREHRLREVFEQALTHAPDLILSTGGVSVGPRDLIREVWTDLGAEEWFWRIAIKPGKPVFAGELHPGSGVGSEHCVLVGLSGTPVANAVVFRTWVRPLLLRLQGHRGLYPEPVRARVIDSYGKEADMTRLLWAEFSGRSEPFEASLSPVLRASKLEGLCRANGLVIMPQGTEPLEPGDTVRGLRFSDPESRSEFEFEPERVS